jgi:chaperonin GroEL
VGDGTTTAVVFVHSLLREVTRMLSAGWCRLSLASEIKRASGVYAEVLLGCSKSVESLRDLSAVAHVSSGADVTIGSLVESAFAAGGREAIISVEENEGKGDRIELSEGLRIERGCHPAFFPLGGDRLVLGRSLVLMCTEEVTNFREQLLPVMERMKATGLEHSLLVISGGMSSVALRSLFVNNSNPSGHIKVVFLRAPGFGGRRERLLRDMSVVLGGRVLGHLSSGEVSMEDLGRADKVSLGTGSSVIYHGKEKSSLKYCLCELLRREMEAALLSIYERNFLKERLKNLSGTITLIRVGGATETELRDRILRTEDALNATRAALEGGIIPGGGVAMYRLRSKALNRFRGRFGGGFRVGFFVGLMFAKVVSQPLKRLVSNAGKCGSVVSQRLRSMPYSFGYDVISEDYGCMFDKGIVDPARVSCLALLNACILVSEYLRTDSLVI